MKKLSVIPQPQSITVGNETVFTLTRLCEIEAGEGAQKAYNDFIRFVDNFFEIGFVGTGKESIILKIEESLNKAESYTLDVTENLIEIKGADEAGVFYGVQSLKQLFTFSGEKLPEIHIKDEPAYSYRGFMLDCGRYFFPKDDVKLFLDIMAVHKLNTFHWHLTEDAGWRAEMENNILLTEIGSYRSHTNFNNKPHGGYYTKADMKEIVEYAHERCIRVIPEIDSPGHMVAAISSYPFLSCFDRDLPVATSWGIKYDVICVGKESTYNFMYSVFDELLEIFTDGVIHLGADEVPTERWSLCPNCQKKMKEENLKDVEDLHAYYLNRIASYIESKGTKVIMWNDRVKDYMAKKSIVRQLWNSDMDSKDIANLLNDDMKFIISASDYYYLDYPYGLLNLRKCYDFCPEYEGTKTDKKGNVLGVEACLWTEFVPTMKKAAYQTFPRLGAFSETAWTKKENKSYEEFEKKLQSYRHLISCYGMESAGDKAANPGFIRKIGSKIYWERRRLCWAGLHNIIDNKKVEKIAKGENKND